MTKEIELCDSLAVFMLPDDQREEKLKTGNFNPQPPCVQPESLRKHLARQEEIERKRKLEKERRKLCANSKKKSTN